MMFAKTPALVAAILGLYTGFLHAQIYQHVDEHGTTVFSDEKTQNAEPVKLPPLPTYQAPKATGVPDPVPESKSSVDSYRKLNIVTPAPGQTVRESSGLVTVAVILEPALDEEAGHRFQFYLDGQAMNQPSKAAKTSFEHVDRGEHRVQVAVVDGKGSELLRSESVKFYLHRYSAHFQEPGTVPGEPVPPIEGSAPGMAPTTPAAPRAPQAPRYRPPAP
jgi:hypothetical protein